RAATADASLFHVSLDLSAHGPLLASHVAAGQFLPFRLPSAPYPIFLAISSPPPASSSASPPRSFDFLVKRLPGTSSARLCDLQPGDLVPVGGSVVGRGFEVTRIADARDVLVFATGSGISPIRSLIESGFGENEKIDVSLFYGVRNLQRMAYQERFSDWESRGIKIIPVLSRPDEQWTGQRGYVQNAFSRAKKVINPSSTGAILCGHKQMTEEITRALVADGMPKDQILTNF
ncbi:fruit protein pKIWI502, partial [Triticum aestivum]|uniref:fruit protein pKIWI502 n=1 Tax=Triticum aestivum TaxID=4565 RepID=UPI001D0179EA